MMYQPRPGRSLGTMEQPSSLTCSIELWTRTSFHMPGQPAQPYPSGRAREMSASVPIRLLCHAMKIFERVLVCHLYQHHARLVWFCEGIWHH
ncbi:hypothetical protein QQF64_023177 [Cirrhinus molitorella]|uniref:Uncharacterized protein n=1 Tax=Cirrhinus molitorella TaxID=172907 RepID=A0ABR3L6T8_9TELE